MAETLDISLGGRDTPHATQHASTGASMESVRDKVAVVTGGASGIGRELCRAFARAGARIVIADMDERGMSETAAAAKQDGSQAITVRTDVSRLADVQALADRAYA